LHKQAVFRVKNGLKILAKIFRGKKINKSGPKTLTDCSRVLCLRLRGCQALAPDSRRQEPDSRKFVPEITKNEGGGGETKIEKNS
jgi:hypothetical protein